MTKDLRKSQRINLEAPVKIVLENGEKVECQSFNFSDKGLYVALDAQTLERFAMGDIAELQFQGLTYTPPIATAEVVRLDSRGAGFKIHSTYQPEE